MTQAGGQARTQQVRLPSESEFNDFAAKLRDFRRTLPEGQQRILDGMVHASFETGEKQDVKAYSFDDDRRFGWYWSPWYHDTRWEGSWRRHWEHWGGEHGRWGKDD